MYDVAVVGAGPAGLAAGTAARLLGSDVLIVEQGKPLDDRSQNDRNDVVSGVGGAGLYSDGKFSFFPSATALWAIQPTHTLTVGYEWLSGILSSAGMVVPRFPLRLRVNDAHTGAMYRKEYPSFYLPINKRSGVLQALADELQECLSLPCCITALEHHSGDYVRLLRADGSLVAEARCVVLALGRLGPLTLQDSLAADDLVFRRVEIGVRIEQATDAFVLRGDPYLDPKIICDKGDGRSWRTFCCCRDGLVVFTSSAGLSAVSGRADCPPTGRSNVGLLIRFSRPRVGMAAWRALLRTQPQATPTIENTSAIMDRSGHLRADSRLVEVLGPDTARHLVEGLNDLADFTGRPLTQAALYAPAIEGVGLYPRIGPDLKIPGRPIYVAGDATGIFRGLTAALVSGFVAGSAAATLSQDQGSRRKV